jgi:hypothetical protein
LYTRVTLILSRDVATIPGFSGLTLYSNAIFV